MYSIFAASKYLPPLVLGADLEGSKLSQHWFIRSPDDPDKKKLAINGALKKIAPAAATAQQPRGSGRGDRPQRPWRQPQRRPPRRRLRQRSCGSVAAGKHFEDFWMFLGVLDKFGAF